MQSIGEPLTRRYAPPSPVNGRGNLDPSLIHEGKVHKGKMRGEKGLNPSLIYEEKSLYLSLIHRKKVHGKKNLDPSFIHGKKVHGEKNLNPSPALREKVAEGRMRVKTI
jgi:hypothetical protein